MSNGTINWFSDSKRYGFIEQEEGADVFVHRTAINATRLKSLNEVARQHLRHATIHVPKPTERDRSSLVNGNINRFSHWKRYR